MVPEVFVRFLSLEAVFLYDLWLFCPAHICFQTTYTNTNINKNFNLKLIKPILKLLRNGLFHIYYFTVLIRITYQTQLIYICERATRSIS